MKKYLQDIQSRLPEGIFIENEHNIDLTEAEFVSILCWVKYFNAHYKEHGKTKYPEVILPIISEKVFLDFGLYITPNTDGKHVIYINRLKDKPKKYIGVWGL